MTYELPRTDDGEVDWTYVCEEIRQAVDDEPGHYPMMDILGAAIAAARADEREACAKMADEEAVGWAGTDGNEVDVCESLSLAIRARGDSQ